MLLRTPAAAPAKCLRPHGKARIFAVYTAVSARPPKTEGTATPRGKLFPRRDLPRAIDGRPHPLVRPLGSRTGISPPKENRYETHNLRHLDGHRRPVPRGHAYRSRRTAHLGS